MGSYPMHSSSNLLPATKEKCFARSLQGIGMQQRTTIKITTHFSSLWGCSGFDNVAAVTESASL